MKGTMLAVDLDNTLLYSHKHRQNGDICVEWIHDEPQGYMPQEVWTGLQKIARQMMIVPVTTRSILQYQRIHWPEGSTPEYAVVANGAILLHNSQPDEDWQRIMRPTIEPWLDEMAALTKAFEKRTNLIRVRIVDNSYMFVYVREMRDIPAFCDECANLSKLHIITSGKKVYLLPPGIEKGVAIQLLKARFQPDKLIAAGDSPMDDSMLVAADESYTIAHSSDILEGNHIHFLAGELFPQNLIGYILELFSP